MTGPTPQPRKPVILTVDDDPAVSRAVARDLRRHYGERYRIVRAESGTDALETLHELKLRGDTVAVFVADYRMPQMSGIEFLEEAMDIYPLARRVLLTAYADTHAAIDAINVVDLDHYLLKPWDPPEEKLYPVIDALLDAWLVSDHRPVPETKVVGHRWSARCSEVREFLARNQVPYRWYNSDEPEARRQAAKFGAEVLTTRNVVSLDICGSARRVTFADGTSIDAHTVILATGVTYRQLAAPGLPELTGRGVYYGSALTETSACLGQDIYVVGGANSDGQDAVFLSRHAKSVTILVRGPSLERSMSCYLIKQIEDVPNLSVRTCTQVIEAHGDDHLESLTLQNTASGETETVDAQLLFLFIGAAPLTDWLDGVVVRDSREIG